VPSTDTNEFKSRGPIPTALVTGGAGYIGSHVALALLDAGWRVVVLDDLSTGRRELVPPAASFHRGDVGDRELVTGILRRHACAAVLHFAGSIQVAESMVDPLKYFRNNTTKSTILLEACRAARVNAFVFSSSAAVYGAPERMPIGEDTPTQPLNPYGRSKLMTEWVLEDVARAYGLCYVALRYFNVAGADPAGRTGQAGPETTHLIKVASEVAVGSRLSMEVFGTDYPTPDGTAVRDYIHVSDLADAHLVALRHLIDGGESLTLNCGYGHGYSVREVIAMAEKVAGRPIPVRDSARRAGDPPILIADPSRLVSRFGWQPRFDDLETIVTTAIAWERRLATRGPAARAGGV